MMRQLIRSFIRHPGFTIPAVLTLALGIGVNVAIFSVIESVILAPLPYPQPDRLVMIWGKTEKGSTTWLSAPEVREYAAERDTFAGVSAYDSVAMNLEGDDPERVVVGTVTPNAFATLGVRPLIGRTFSPSQKAEEISNQIVLGHGIWQRRFGGKPDVIGRSIVLNGKGWTVIGVMPAGFKLPLDFTDDGPTELWVPFAFPSMEAWGDHSYIGFARLRDGVSPRLASQTMHELEEKWVREGNWKNFADPRHAIPVKDLIVGNIREALWLLFGAVALILFIACANVANLVLAHGDDRRRELAMRSALGASRMAILRRLLVENLVLAFTGGVVGLLVASAGLRTLLAVRPAGIPRLEAAALDPRALLFALVLSVATIVLFGLAPALAMTSRDLAGSIKEGGRQVSDGRRRNRLRDILTIAQLSLSVLLLIGAILLTRTLMNLSRTDLGFDTRNVLTFRISLPTARYADTQRVIDAMRLLRHKFAELPGVQSAGAVRALPLTGTIGDWSITIEGRQAGPEDNPKGDWQVATPGYLETMRIPILRGRVFTERDNENAPIVAVINQTMAARYWPRGEALGKRFHIGTADQPWITIVGIIGEVRHESVTEAPRAEMIVPDAQWAAAGASARRAMTFVLKSRSDPATLVSQVRDTLRSIDPRLPMSEVRTLDQVARDALASQRFSAMLLVLLAVLALALATIGIYGVISLIVARRRQEIGVRLALGASAASILKNVLSRGLRLAAVGTAIGLAGAALLTRLLTALLYGVTPLDPATFLIVPAVLALVALGASLVPAGRAARVDPAIALRTE